LKRHGVGTDQIVVLSFDHVSDKEGYYVFYFEIAAKKGDKYYLLNNKD
jgi:hypothetical protein